MTSRIPKIVSFTNQRLNFSLNLQEITPVRSWSFSTKSSNWLNLNNTNHCMKMLPICSNYPTRCPTRNQKFRIAVPMTKKGCQFIRDSARISKHCLTWWQMKNRSPECFSLKLKNRANKKRRRKTERKGGSCSGDGKVEHYQVRKKKENNKG